MLLPLLFAFFAGFALILGFMPVGLDNRPKLQLNIDDPLTGMPPLPGSEAKKKGPWDTFFLITGKIAVFNRPLAVSPIGRRVYRDLGMEKSRMTVEEFFLIKEVLIGVLFFSYPAQFFGF